MGWDINARLIAHHIESGREGLGRAGGPPHNLIQLAGWATKKSANSFVYYSGCRRAPSDSMMHTDSRCQQPIANAAPHPGGARNPDEPARSRPTRGASLGDSGPIANCGRGLVVYHRPSL